MVGPVTKSLFTKSFLRVACFGAYKVFEKIRCSSLTTSSILELGLPGFRGVRIRPNAQFSRLEQGLSGLRGVRIRPNAQFSRLEQGLPGLRGIGNSPINIFTRLEIDLLRISKVESSLQVAPNNSALRAPASAAYIFAKPSIILNLNPSIQEQTENTDLYTLWLSVT